MSETINLGWLQDHKNVKFAPKTISTQILTQEGKSYVKQVENQFSAVSAQLSQKPGSIVVNEENSKAEIFNDLDTNKATGNYSHAEGSNTIASGNYSHAEGSNTIASGNYSHVQGKYNIEDTENRYAHIVGNGGYNDNGELINSNAHTVDWSGNAWYAGNVSFDGALILTENNMYGESLPDSGTEGQVFLLLVKE